MSPARDWPVLMLTRLAAALFWFNPLVWLLEREVVQQAEEAADCEAAACVEPARYARTLLSWAQVNGRMIPANSIAPSGSALARRIRAILDRRLRERPSGSALTAIAAMLCIAIAAPVAAMQLVQAARPPAPAAPRRRAPERSGRRPRRPDAPRAAGRARMRRARRRRPPRRPRLGDIPDVGPIVAQALAEARASMDPEEIQRSVDEALREADRRSAASRRAERARIAGEVRRAVAAGARPGRPGRPRRRSRRRCARRGRRRRPAPRAVAMAMASAGEGMASGAAGMEAGARHMEEQARRFRDRAYREQVIAREAARGHHVTHEQLIEAADGMEEGARGMREGAREMREAGPADARRPRRLDPSGAKLGRWRAACRPPAIISLERRACAASWAACQAAGGAATGLIARRRGVVTHSPFKEIDMKTSLLAAAAFAGLAAAPLLAQPAAAPPTPPSTRAEMATEHRAAFRAARRQS